MSKYVSEWVTSNIVAFSTRMVTCGHTIRWKQDNEVEKTKSNFEHVSRGVLAGREKYS